MTFKVPLLNSVAIAAIAVTGLYAAPALAQASDDQSEIVVTGIRKSIADSIETKRKANSIVDVLSAEDVGKLPDTNVAESLSRLPGITVDHQFGEGEQLSIAGVEPALNRLTIDGHSIASADWGGNPSDRSSRTFNYSLLSPSIISQAVVYKTPEARLQEGAIGASVDVVTRKPLDLKPNTIAATGGYEYNERVDKGSVRGSALYSWHNDAGTFGILLGGNYDKQQLARAGVATYWYRTGADLLGNAPATATVNGTAISALSAADKAAFGTARYASMLAREYFRQQRERIGFNGAVQVKPADNLTFTGTAMVIRGNYDNVSNSIYTFGYDGSGLTSATFTPGKDGNPGIVTSASFAGITNGNGATGELDANYRRTRVKNDSYALLMDWKPGGWDVTGNVGYTKASGGKNPEYLLDFRTQQGFTAGANGQSTNVNWQSPANDASKWLSNYTALGGETITRADGSTFVGRQIGGIPTQSGFTIDKEWFGELNVKRDVNWGPITTILFGGRYADHTNSNTTYSNAVYTNQNYTLADLNPTLRDPSLYDGLGASGNGLPFYGLDQASIISTLNKYGTYTVDRGLSQSDYWLVKERIGAGYVQANFEVGKFRGNIGGRFVHTEDQSNYYVSGQNAAKQTVYTLTRSNTDDNRFLPAANLIYQAGEDVVLRGSVAKVIARVRYSDLAGSLSLDDSTSTGSGGNPDLKPYAATNFGFSTEWYFAPGSYISGEIFYRDISNYVGNEVDDGPDGQGVLITNTATGQTRRYSITRPVNGGKASVTGFSISGNTNLIWGFGIQANYTFADADTQSKNGLPYLSRDTFTISPYFEKGPFQARVSYNRRSKYFYRFGRQSSSDYTAAYRELDAQISYNLNKAISFTASASNLLDETYYQYSSTPDAPTSIYKNGRVFSLSATLRM